MAIAIGKALTKGRSGVFTPWPHNMGVSTPELAVLSTAWLRASLRAQHPVGIEVI